MKKYLLKSFALLAMLFSAITMSAKQYCHEPLTLSGGATIYLSCELISDGQYRITIEGENLQGLGGSFYDPGAVDLRNAITTKTETKIVCDIAATSAPTLYTPLYVLCPGEQNIGWPNDIDWTGTCGEGGESEGGEGGNEPDPTPEPEEPVEPEIVESNYCQTPLTSGTNTIYLTCEKVSEGNYQIVIEGEQIGAKNLALATSGSHVIVNNEKTSNITKGSLLRLYINTELSTTSKIICEIPSTVEPKFDGPLYVNMPSEVSFGAINNIVWGTCPEPTEDNESPVMTSATFVSASDKSVVIAVEATDNVKVASYLVKNGDVELGSFTAVNNNITVTGLEPGTTYQLTVYAKDASDNISAEGIIVEVTTSSIPMSPYCETEVGHQGNVNADPNSFILLSIGSDGAGHTIVNIKQDAAKNSSMFDYINIVGIKDIGSDINAGGSDAMAILFKTPTPNAEGNITFTIQWSTVNWGGRWEYVATFPAEAICANADPYPSEPYLYCSYTDNNLKWGNANVTLTWATDASGNVVIDIEDGEGASNSAFRNGGFELGGGLSFADSWKVYSGTNHQTVEDATVYFNEGGTLSNNDKRYTLTKKAEAVLPANAVIVWMGHAFSWKNDQAGGAYSIDKTFAYSYGESCPSLETPTNVAVSEEGIITFTGSVLAETYTASVYLGGILKYRQDVTNGGTLNYTPYVSGTYQVTVTASATGYPTTAPSEPCDWQRTVVPASPTNSAYCEQEMSNGKTLAKFTWETDDNGNIIITIAEALGGESSASIFRANGFNISNLRVGTHSPGSDYFTSSWVGSVQTLALKDPNVKPGIGEPITYNGIVEYSTSKDTVAWPTLQFNDYLYGAKCEGQKRVTASVNDAAMGTAKVNGQDEVYVNPDTEVTFTATPNEGYVFANWTKGDEVVSTSATYTTTITSALSLVANFDYERIAYCHYEVLATGGDAAGKKLYLTLGSNGTGKYYIKFEGSVEAPLASLNNANYMVNGVSTDILIDGVTSSGQDVPFTKANGRWSFDAAGYGSAMMEFSLADGKTISDIFVWTNFIAFGVVGGGELIYEDNQDRNKLFGNPAPLRYSIDWDNVCVDDEAPVLVAPQAKALNATDVQLTLKATDNWDGLITYNISYHPTSDASSPVTVSTTGASAEEITYDILALTTGVEYTLTITVSDGTNTSAAQTCVVTPAGDTEKPVMGTATLVSKTHKSAIIAVFATDNDEVGSYHVVCTNPAYGQTLTPTEGQITLTGLTAATAYNFTITAIDIAGNESEGAATVECTTNPYNAKPTSAPTPPTHDAKQVKSVFSDVYGGTFSAMEGWGQATQFEELNFNGDYVRYYTNLNYLGWATGSPINASVMEKLHLDIWAAEDATIIIVPIYGGPGLTTNDKKTKTVTLKGQEWNSIDLTLATDFAGLDLSSIFQFKFDAPQGTDKFAIDNVYFYTTQVASDVTPPANLKATAVPSFTTAVINCQATDESGSISYQVYLGAELKGTGSADSGKTASITVTNLQPNREFTMTIIATDVYGNESAETVDVTFTTLSYPAPAPTPTWDATKVFSIYSDAYTAQATRAFGWGWGASTVEAQVELAAGDNALQYTTSNYAGWELNGNTTIGDLTAYPYLHMDIYVENAGSIQFTPIWGAEALKEYTLQAGWNSLDINLVAEFTGINLKNIYQLKWAAMPATCFIDNVYFFDGLIEGVVIDDDSDLTQLRDGFIYNLTLKRNFVMDGDWNTICLPFALDADQVKEVFGEGTTLVKLKESTLLSATEIDLVFAPETAMEASTPYLIKPAQNVDAGVALEGVVINLTPNVIETDDANMIPVLKTQSFTGENNTFYLGANENLYPRPTSREIKAMRAYFQFPNLTAAQASKLRARVVVEENVETALDNVSGQKQENIKVISNGQLIIIHDGGKYNAQGVKISE